MVVRLENYGCGSGGFEADALANDFETVSMGCTLLCAWQMCTSEDDKRVCRHIPEGGGRAEPRTRKITYGDRLLWPVTTYDRV